MIITIKITVQTETRRKIEMHWNLCTYTNIKWVGKDQTNLNKWCFRDLWICDPKCNKVNMNMVPLNMSTNRFCPMGYLQIRLNIPGHCVAFVNQLSDHPQKTHIYICILFFIFTEWTWWKISLILKQKLLACWRLPNVRGVVKLKKSIQIDYFLKWKKRICINF
jgi:hypothetical protein